MGKWVHANPMGHTDRAAHVERAPAKGLSLGSGLAQLDSIPKPSAAQRIAARERMMRLAPDLIEMLGLE
jgi:hypothetical protein